MNRVRWELSVFASRWRNRLRYLSAAPRLYRNWWAWPLPKLGIGVILELRNGLRYLVRPGTSDLAVLNEAVLRNPYLSPGYVQLREDAVVVDVGANIGDFTIQEVALCPRGRIYAVEPISQNARMIEVNKLLNGMSNIEVFPVALGADEGEITIHVAGSQSSSYFFSHQQPEETVRLITLPRLMQECGIERIDLLKLDCEGAEWDILPACSALLPRIDQICMECHPRDGWTAARLAAWLRDAGYQVRHTEGGWNGLLWATRRATRPLPQVQAQA